MDRVQEIKMSNRTILTMGANANKKLMRELYWDQIESTIWHRKEYFKGHKFDSRNFTSLVNRMRNRIKGNEYGSFSLYLGESLEAIYEYRTKSKRLGLLCYASPEIPCAGFIHAPYSQEGRICSVSGLYTIMTDDRVQGFYYYNHIQSHDGNYEPHVLYLPKVPFYPDGLDRDHEFQCNILLSAPPVWRLTENHPELKSGLLKNLKNHLRMIFDVAKDNRIDTLLIGPYGCEPYFGWEPWALVDSLVAVLEEYKENFKNIVFVIPKHEQAGYSKFVAAFEGHGYLLKNLASSGF